ncbi:MAG: ATP-dependent zinc metalloprotease FtsH [Lachnospiraceae bacterium]|nr:ATP-dependent zinc metalloprotease FtsH [Lachnospiraceae bacterium]
MDERNTNQGGNGQGNHGQGGPGNQNPKKVNLLLLLIAALITLGMTSFFMKSVSKDETKLSYTEFMEKVESGYVEGQPNSVVESVQFGSDRIAIQMVESEEKKTNPLAYYYGMGTRSTYYTALVEDDTLPERLREMGVEVWGYIPDSSGFIMEILLYYILPLVAFWVLLSFLFKKMGKGGGPMGVGKSNAKVYVQKETGITFKDVAGEDEAKESLQEVVDFLHNPGKYTGIGAKLPKGALLVGPPGTGKTLLAKAVAGEAGVPFFSLAGSDFIELYVGVGASRVRDLFKEASKHAPCIIFIDEIDAIGRSRDSKYGGGNEEREQTLNQLLSEMDGFDTSKGILILGATNRPEILDKALLRPGRFDRRIIVDKPDLKGRVEILKVHAKDVKMDETVDLDAIALATSGAVGADLANMINEAAINAVKGGREFVSQKDLFDAVEQVLVGKEKKDRIMSKEERKIVSYHEVGHALVSALQKNSEPVQKITIVPRTMGALGYVMHVPEEEKYLNTEAELRDMLVGLVAGRAAEELVFETVTTGAANDIEKATRIARSMVTLYGMSKRFGLVGLSTVESKYLEGREVMNCSDETAAAVDEEVIAILKESYDKAKALLSENRELMDKLAAFLIEKETITGKEFMQIFRKEKGIPEPEEENKDKSEESKNKTEDAKTSDAEKPAEEVQGEKAETAENDVETEAVTGSEEAEKDTAEETFDVTEEKTEEREKADTDNVSEPEQPAGKSGDVGVFTKRTFD